jgi:hypothetical protein
MEAHIQEALAADVVAYQEQLARFRRVGTLLQDAKARLPTRREWIAWLHSLSLRVQVADVYMEFAALMAKEEARQPA